MNDNEMRIALDGLKNKRNAFINRHNARMAELRELIAQCNSDIDELGSDIKNLNERVIGNEV